MKKSNSVRGRAPITSKTRSATAAGPLRTVHDEQSRTAYPQGFDVGNAASTVYMSLARRHPKLKLKHMHFADLAGPGGRPKSGDRLENVQGTSNIQAEEETDLVPGDNELGEGV